MGNALVCASIEEVGKVPVGQEVKLNFPRSVICGGLKVVKDHRFRSAPLRSSTASKVVGLFFGYPVPAYVIPVGHGDHSVDCSVVTEVLLR